MSLTFTKLFSSITESTIWCEAANIRLVWITMLAMCDRHGRVHASVPGLANRARVPVEDTEQALAKFLAPDKYSRTSEFEGRRIEPIPGGWRLLNHSKYRDMRDEEVRREQNREAKEKQRKRESANLLTVSHGQPESADASAHADTDTDAEITSKPSAPSATRSALTNDIIYDWKTFKFVGVTERDQLDWQDIYPAVSVPDQIGRAAAWLRTNPTKRKSNYRRFLNNWLARAQDRGRPIK